MEILIIQGSSSAHSYTRSAVRFLEERLLQRGVTTASLELATVCMAIQEMEHYYAPPNNSTTEMIRAAVANADAVLLASPVHHSSFSGLLKSGLDHLAAGAFTGKPVGILAMAGGIRSASAACDQLRGVVRALGGWASPTHVGLCNGDMVDGAISSEMLSRIDAMCLELCCFPGHERGESALDQKGE